ncbi:hypothetical protein EW145_g1880 [Phellinidium pouzarii]|uniref:Uncharacterized protein n=1 Tax=Phellinidium pouzarii TaxID=167371 RepID=A0A4S4LIB7_9AGAM|nr:hypothetical protein EW145_g1880 [Phellinidium pouzarii]
MDVATESYIMLLLADGNLPTGSFVTSSGLESYIKHGFFRTSSNTSDSSSAARSNQAIIDFMQNNLNAYAHSALPFMSDAHTAVSEYRATLDGSCSKNDIAIGSNEASGFALKRLESLDNLYHSMTMNDVTRRASKAQGVALLTLFSKGLSKPALVSTLGGDDLGSTEEALSHIVDSLKLRIRREDIHGHLPICWGVMTAALGLGLGMKFRSVPLAKAKIYLPERSQYLHLFLQARSLLSASIRLNTLGPYAAQQLLLHVVKGIVEEQIKRLYPGKICCNRTVIPQRAHARTCMFPIFSPTLGDGTGAEHRIVHIQRHHEAEMVA